jgi:mannose-6-phosphate isomerase-like protein (cupin superfamily)
MAVWEEEMKTNRSAWIVSALMFMTGFATAWLVWPRSGEAADQPPRKIKSGVVPLKETPENKGDWGVMRPHFIGETHGTDRVFAASGTILPGKSVHGAHRHVEEEYLLITEGSGTWYLDGKEFPARKGDLLYVEPWVYHGIRNTGDAPLAFLVIKYNSKGVKLPERPDDDRPDELDR